MNRIIVLGSGTSTGIPMVGCQCKVCTSKNPKDQRTRTSIFLQTRLNKHILIDTSPDLRGQILDNDIRKLDFAIITHDHADHLHGIDDLRPFCFGKELRTIPVYTPQKSYRPIVDRFNYIFKIDPQVPILGGGIPRLALNSIEISEKEILYKTIDGEDFYFFYLPHGHKQTMGFVHNQFAYLTDCQKIPDHVIDFLTARKIELIIIGCVQRKTHDTHLGIKECFHYIHTIDPKRAGIIHMNHDFAHNDLQELADENFDFSVFPVYDGQIINYN